VLHPGRAVVEKKALLVVCVNKSVAELRWVCELRFSACDKKGTGGIENKKSECRRTNEIQKRILRRKATWCQRNVEVF
jgi:hypothetical protein